jgi:hypothetical protein
LIKYRRRFVHREELQVCDNDVLFRCHMFLIFSILSDSLKIRYFFEHKRENKINEEKIKYLTTRLNKNQPKYF